MAIKNKEEIIDFYGIQLAFTRKRGRPPKIIKIRRCDYARLKMGMIVEKSTYIFRMINDNN